MFSFQNFLQYNDKQTVTPLIPYVYMKSGTVQNNHAFKVKAPTFTFLNYCDINFTSRLLGSAVKRIYIYTLSLGNIVYPKESRFFNLKVKEI